MSDAATTDRAAGDAAGRHRGPASAEEAGKNPPHGKHRRPQED
jgi:hypothetical protein